MPHIIELVSVGLVFGPTNNPPPNAVAVFPLTVKFINVASVSRINIPPPLVAFITAGHVPAVIEGQSASEMFQRLSRNLSGGRH